MGFSLPLPFLSWSSNIGSIVATIFPFPPNPCIVFLFCADTLLNFNVGFPFSLPFYIAFPFFFSFFLMSTVDVGPLIWFELLLFVIYMEFQ